MTGLRPRRPSASMVVALLALFVALGGTSYAAATLAKNSVGSEQLKKNAVTTKKIKNRAVTGSKIAAQTITGNEIKLGTLGTVPSAAQAASADSVTGLGTLRSGRSESGIWGASGPSGGWAIAEINFPLPLPAPLDSAHTIYVSGSTATHCSGPGKADPGYLCVYTGETSDVSFYGILKPGGGGTKSGVGADQTGTTIYFTTSSTGDFVDGQWTVTAP